MFGSDILDIAIGLVFVYLLLSLICSILNEWIAALFSMRATNLEDGIRNLLTGSTAKPKDGKQDAADELYSHALITGLFKQDLLDKLRGSPGLPSYIPARTFALALLDTVAPSGVGSPQTIQDVRQAIDNLPEGHMKEALQTLVNNAEGDLQRFRLNVEGWFNDSMDRVSGWYKRKSQLVILVLAVIVAVVANADSVSIVNTLIHSPALRASTVEAAKGYVNAPPDASDPDKPLDRVKKIESKLEPLHLPLGWAARPDEPKEEGDPRYFPNSLLGFLIKLFGLSLTAVALSLGAPFWFDILNKFIVIRSTVKPREKSRDEASKDNTSEVQATQNLLTTDGTAPAGLPAGTTATAPAPAAIVLEAATVVSSAPMLAAAPAPLLLGAAARTGVELVNLANQHLGQTYILGARVPLNNANWKGPWDCAEFVSWCVYQLIGKLYGCHDDSEDPGHTDAFTGWWGRDANTVLKRVTVREATNTPGALLLRLPHPGMIGHIVISDGTGGTVEAHGHADGVVNLEVANRHWDMGLLIPELRYDIVGDINVAPPSGIFRLASPFMSGPEVLRIQQQLQAHGIDPGELDGQFGPKTAAAVFSFQAREGLLADGEVGPLTAAALARDVQPVPAVTARSFPGMDMGGYPGDEVMRRLFKDPYVFTGYYLNSPCHRDKPAGRWEPWMGHRQTLKEIGWGLVVVYVGQQVPGASTCSHNTLTRSQGEADGDDAIAKAMSDGLRNGTIIFLDIEAVDVMPSAMLDYAGGWFGRLLSDGHYKPGIYCHGKNATVLFNAAQQAYSSHGRQDETPPFWVVRLRDGFNLHGSTPAESGTPFAVVWQGQIDVKSEAHGNVKVASIDHNVATSDNPSNA
ncbi:MAG: DUF1906 domain-containing protein [Acidobacteria bacterium]|nr:DUF1906 domain-containing protein [Acidobacteriota bacterium]